MLDRELCRVAVVRADEIGVQPLDLARDLHDRHAALGDVAQAVLGRAADGADDDPSGLYSRSDDSTFSCREMFSLQVPSRIVRPDERTVSSMAVSISAELGIGDVVEGDGQDVRRDVLSDAAERL